MDLRPQIMVLLGAQSATMLLRLPRTNPIAEYDVELIFLLLMQLFKGCCCIEI